MFCTKCGQGNPDNAVFCSGCGNKLSASGGTPVPPDNAKPGKKKLLVLAGVLVAIVLVAAIVLIPRLFSAPSIDGNWHLSISGTLVDNQGAVSYDGELQTVDLSASNGTFTLKTAGTSPYTSTVIQLIGYDFSMAALLSEGLEANGSYEVEEKTSDEVIYRFTFDTFTRQEPSYGLVYSNYMFSELQGLQGQEFLLHVPKSGFGSSFGEGSWYIETIGADRPTEVHGVRCQPDGSFVIFTSYDGSESIETQGVWQPSGDAQMSVTVSGIDSTLPNLDGQLSFAS